MCRLAHLEQALEPYRVRSLEQFKTECNGPSRLIATKKAAGKTKAAGSSWTT